MKKIIKIIALLMFILLLFGIATSKTSYALSVDTSTSQSSLTTALDNGETLVFGDGWNVFKYNPWVFCRQKGGYLRHFRASYTLESKVNYPDENVNGSYAIAYAFAYGKTEGYSKDDIQAAYWKLLGYDPNGNPGYAYGTNAKNLVNRASEFETFKRSELQIGTDIRTPNNNDDSRKVGNKLIYGPIYINYAYSGGFGGFDFTFKDSNGNVISSNHVKLCSDIGGNSPIDSNTGKVRTANWNGEPLYIAVDLNNVSDENIKMYIKYNTVNVTATLYQIRGTTEVNSSERIYCDTCLGKAENFENGGSYSQGDIVKYNGSYWEYNGASGRRNTIKYNTSNTMDYTKYKFGNNEEINNTVTRK